LDGPIKEWNDDEKKWIRYNNKKVALKSLDKSLSINDEFLKEVNNLI